MRRHTGPGDVSALRGGGGNIHVHSCCTLGVFVIVVLVVVGVDGGVQRVPVLWLLEAGGGREGGEGRGGDLIWRGRLSIEY